MSENRMLEMSLQHGELPMQKTLCVFKRKLTNGNDLFIIGILIFDNEHFRIKRYGTEDVFLASNFTHYHYVLNEDGGFYSI